MYSIMTRIEFPRIQRKHWLVTLLALAVWPIGLTISSAQSVVVTQVHAFESGSFAANCRSLILGGNGALYGTFFPNAVSAPGRIFMVNRDGSGYSQQVEITNRLSSLFQTGLPESRVIQGRDGELYGVTPIGGTNGFGKVFTLDANLSGYTVLRDCGSVDNAPASILQGTDGALYIVGHSIFRLNTDGSGFSVLHTFNSLEGDWPIGQLMQGSDGALYGTSYFGGPNDFGTIFKVNTNGDGFAVLHSFSGASDGKYPMSGVIQGSDGALYGTASEGGATGNGTVFKLNTDGSGYVVLHQFAGAQTDGAFPLGELAEDLGGNALFGTTYAGSSGTNNQGTIFKIGLDGGSYSTVYSFAYPSKAGAKPITGLVRGQSEGDIGVFYGTTSFGVSGGGGGAVFAMLVNPPLEITPVVGTGATNQTVVFWPEWAFNYKLQSTTNLASTNWVTITNGVPVTGVQITSTNPSVFYRLISP